MSEFDVNAAIEAIAAKVHQGWVEQKQLGGFKDHAFEGQWVKRNRGAVWCCEICHSPYSGEHHPDMLPYAELPENVKGYNRATARMVFAWLEENGWQVVRKEAQP